MNTYVDQHAQHPTMKTTQLPVREAAEQAGDEEFCARYDQASQGTTLNQAKLTENIDRSVMMVTALAMFKDGSAYGSAFRSSLLPTALVSSPGHCLDLD